MIGVCRRYHTYFLRSFITSILSEYLVFVVINCDAWIGGMDPASNIGRMFAAPPVLLDVVDDQYWVREEAEV